MRSSAQKGSVISRVVGATEGFWWREGKWVLFNTKTDSTISELIGKMVTRTGLYLRLMVISYCFKIWAWDLFQREDKIRTTRAFQNIFPIEMIYRCYTGTPLYSILGIAGIVYRTNHKKWCHVSFLLNGTLYPRNIPPFFPIDEWKNGVSNFICFVPSANVCSYRFKIWAWDSFQRGDKIRTISFQNILPRIREAAINVNY